MKDEEHPEILDRATRKALLLDQLKKHWEEAVELAQKEGISSEELLKSFSEEYIPEWHATYDQEIEREKARLKALNVKIADPGLGEEQSKS